MKVLGHQEVYSECCGSMGGIILKGSLQSRMPPLKLFLQQMNSDECCTLGSFCIDRMNPSRHRCLLVLCVSYCLLDLKRVDSNLMAAISAVTELIANSPAKQTQFQLVYWAFTKLSKTDLTNILDSRYYWRYHPPLHHRILLYARVSLHCTASQCQDTSAAFCQWTSTLRCDGQWAPSTRLCTRAQCQSGHTQSIAR